MIKQQNKIIESSKEENKDLTVKVNKLERKQLRH